MTDSSPRTGSHRQTAVAGAGEAPPVLDAEADVGVRVWPVQEDDTVLRDRRDRLRSDAEIIVRLGDADFTGPVWETLQDELARYGVQRLKELMANGGIFRKCAERGVPRPRTEIPFHDREDLAEETVGRALERFRKSLRAGEWKPGGGATLCEFFVGFAVPIWASVFKVWRGQFDRDAQMVRVDEEGPAGERADLRSWDPGPEELAVTRQTIRERLSALGKKYPLLPGALVLTDEGYDQGEIAEALDTTIKSVEGVLYRHRKTIGAEQDRTGRERS